MALQSPVLIETLVLDHTVLTTNSVHIVGTVPENCVIISAGSECVSAATVGGANAVSLGVTGGDIDSVGTADINAGKTSAAIVTTVNGITKFTNASTVISAKLAASNAPSAGSYKFFVAYIPMGATKAAAEAARDILA
jgi:hypothetical protein|tara:strand:- start:3114 stop:3527 length:414 start_codon:yes stop_codon:yes gene_type:complete